MDDDGIMHTVLTKNAQAVIDKISDHLENTIDHAISIAGLACAQSMARSSLSIIYSLQDYELALEWAARFDAKQVSCEYGTWVALVNMAKAQAEAEAQQTASVLSEGSVTIIVGVAAAVVFGLGGFLIGRKKKPEEGNL